MSCLKPFGMGLGLGRPIAQSGHTRNVNDAKHLSDARFPNGRNSREFRQRLVSMPFSWRPETWLGGRRRGPLDLSRKGFSICSTEISRSPSFDPGERADASRSRDSFCCAIRAFLSTRPRLLCECRIWMVRENYNPKFMMILEFPPKISKGQGKRSDLENRCSGILASWALGVWSCTSFSEFFDDIF